MTDAASRPPPADPARPDLTRLRIRRDDRKPRPYRSFPWFGILLVLGAVGAAWMFREPLLGLVASVREPEVVVGRAVRVVPGKGGESDVSANGYVVANRQASVATVLSGRLVELHAEEGDVVPEGAVMARIQYDDYEAAWGAAEQRVRVAEAQVEEAKRSITEARAEFPRLEAVTEALERDRARARDTRERLRRDVARNRPLRDQNLIDEATWDRIQVESENAEQAVAAAEARAKAAAAAVAAWSARVSRLEAGLAVAEGNVTALRRDAEVAEITLEKTKILAPFEGLVIRKDAELGEVIAPTGAGNSRGSVFTIVDPGSLEVQVELSEKRIRRVQEGDTATIFLDAAPDDGITGRVRKIWPRADRTKGTIELRVTFDDRPPETRPEMAARVVFLGDRGPADLVDPYVTVPATAVVVRGDGHAVYVLEDGVARLRPVVPGREEGGRRVISEGLVGGETVLLEPGGDVRDGMALRAKETR